jgi:AraC-like DNA-binding protein
MSRPRRPTLPARDPLGETLHLLRLTGVLYCQSELRAPWGIDIPDLDGCLSFQVVTEGRFWLEVDGVPPRWVERGSIVVIPDGRPHRARSQRRARLVPLDQLPVVAVTDCFEHVTFGGSGERTRITYGVLRFDRVAAQRLLSLLPPLLVVDGFADDIESGWLRESVRLINRESASRCVGGEALVTRLADILVIQVIRSWLDSAPEAQSGWLAALRDPQIGRALAAIHGAPASDWSVQRLAKESGMSRSAFSAQFTRLVGEPAMQYVTGWRMQLARAHLRQTSDTLGQTAGMFGYSTEAAFCKAFKRTFGAPPSSVR